VQNEKEKDELEKRDIVKLKNGFSDIDDKLDVNIFRVSSVNNCWMLKIKIILKKNIPIV
jgi:hypothetical protein